MFPLQQDGRLTVRWLHPKHLRLVPPFLPLTLVDPKTQDCADVFLWQLSTKKEAMAERGVKAGVTQGGGKGK